MANDDPHRGNRKNVSREFNAVSFLWRLLFSLFLVLATYNPSGVSVYHWVFNSESLGAVHFFVAALLLIGWTILWVATWRSLDTVGVILASLAIGTLVWLLIDIGLLDPATSAAFGWIALISLAVLLSIGLSWSHVWRRLTGQFEVDEDA